jgi:hypothetical protein
MVCASEVVGVSVGSLAYAAWCTSVHARVLVPQANSASFLPRQVAGRGGGGDECSPRR